MNQSGQILKSPRTVALSLLIVFLTAGTALAIDPPPQDPYQQRTWLAGHLVADVNALGTFDGYSVANLVNGLRDDQVALLTQYYFLTRSKTEQDAYLYALQQQGYPNAQLVAARAALADVLAAMNNQALACYSTLMAMPAPLPYLTQVCYASVPGWCCQASCYVPESYYSNGYYVGPCFNAIYAGAWAVPVYRAYHDHGSHFYSVYHRFAPSVYISNSLRVGKLHADWFRQHSDWRNAPRDRVVTPGRSASEGHARNVRQDSSPRQHPSVQNQISKRASSVQDRRVATPSVARAGSRQPVVQQQARAPRVSPATASNTQASRPAARTSTSPASRASYSAPAARATYSATAARASHSSPAPRGSYSAPASHAETRGGDSNQQHRR